jgi:ATP-dependent protease ClpP protease subunit
MKFIVMLLAMFSTFALSKPITLTTTNHVALTGGVFDKNINKVIHELGTHKLKTLYLVINSNGGSLDAGMKLVQFLDSTSKNITCIAVNAGSMAFVIFEYCKKRIIVNHGELFHHFISSDIPRMSLDKLSSLLKSVEKIQTKILSDQASRFGIPYPEYYARISEDLYVHADDAVKENMADEVRSVKCSSKLAASRTISKKKATGIMSIFSSNVEVESVVGGCPLYSDPSGGSHVQNTGPKTQEHDTFWNRPLY